MNLKSTLLTVPLLFSDCDVQAWDPPERPHYTVPAGDRLVDPRLADKLVSPATKTPYEKKQAEIAREVARCVFLKGKLEELDSSSKQQGLVEYATWRFEDDRYRYNWSARNVKVEKDVFNFGDDNYQYDGLNLTMCSFNDLEKTRRCVDYRGPFVAFDGERQIRFESKKYPYEIPLDGIREPQNLYDEASKVTLERCNKPKIS